MNTNKKPMGNGIEFKAQNRDKVRLELHWPTMEKMARSGKKERVFVCSMTDLFLEDYDVSTIAEVFAVIALNQNKTFQVLTKRAQRMNHILKDPVFWDIVHFRAIQLNTKWCLKSNLNVLYNTNKLPNVWLGVTAEDQKNANERISLLLDTPAAIHFVSYEPALEYVNFEWWMRKSKNSTGTYLDQVIMGGESGSNARPFDPNWCLGVLEYAGEGLVSAFVKQMGENCTDKSMRLSNRHGDDPNDWHEWLRVQEFPDDTEESKVEGPQEDLFRQE